MTSLFSQWLHRAATCGLAALLSGTIAATAYVAPAAADDIEVFFGPRPSQVNILFVFDTSATMWTLEAGSTESLYSDHRGAWGEQLLAIDPGAYVCGPDRVFFRKTGGPMPVCSAATPGISNSAGSNNLSCVVDVTNGDLESQLANESQGVLYLPNNFSVSQYGTSAPT
ncbi:MAG TPA: hypothetical protein VFG48_01295, partial [Xanthomonadales bacterium]|nr:hypothetical protein [Xanthomonadales bacterium]